MYEYFTDRARKAMQLANQEAHRAGHDYIGPEHLLLGLVKEGSGLAAHVLKYLGIDLAAARREVVKLVPPALTRVVMGKLPRTPRAEKVIEHAVDETRGLTHNYVGTEHLLLALLRDQEGVAAQILMNRGFKLEDVRGLVLSCLQSGVVPRGQRDAPPPDLERVTQNAPPLKDPGQVESWFRARYPGKAFSAPRQLDQGILDYNHLVYCDVVPFEGKQVPMLLFVRGGEQARVYVLSVGQFTLPEGADARDGQGARVLYQRAPANPDFGLVIVYTSPSLQPFLTGEPPTPD